MIKNLKSAQTGKWFEAQRPSYITIISYNESPISEIILNGLTTVSTDFVQMGRLIGDMILEKRLEKVHCNFRMTRRDSF